MAEVDRRVPPYHISRAWLSLTSAALFIAFCILAAGVRNRTGPIGLDTASDRVINSSAFSEAFGLLSRAQSNSIFGEIVTLGSPVPALAVVVALVAIAGRRRDRPALVLCALGPLLAVVLCELVAKPVVARYQLTHLAFPSGHVTVATALSALILILLYRWHGPRVLLRWTPIVAVIPLAVSAAVVRLHVHQMTDAIGGLALGVSDLCK